MFILKKKLLCIIILIESKIYLVTKRDQNRIKELKKEIPFYGELSTSESKEKESYKRLVIDLKMELKSLEEKIKK